MMQPLLSVCGISVSSLSSPAHCLATFSTSQFVSLAGCYICFLTFCALQTGSYSEGVTFGYKLFAGSPVGVDIVTWVLLPVLYCESWLCLPEMVLQRLDWPQTLYVDLDLILLPLPAKCWHYREKQSHLAASVLFTSIPIKVWHLLGGSFLSIPA